MAKIDTDDIINMGFGPEMYGHQDVADEAFLALITSHIDEQAVILEGRAGSTQYANTADDIAAYVKRAEKCLVAAEMVQARILRVMGNVPMTAEKFDTTALDRQKKKYTDEAEALIAKLVANAAQDSQGFASGVTVSSHFPEAS